jgi:ubiquinone/menaquinone biosynthesis C-methylase UbiE
MSDLKQKSLTNYYEKQDETSFSSLMSNLDIGEFSDKRINFMNNFDFKGLNVLEIGIGQGYNLKFYKNAKSIVGLDVSKNMISFCEREVERLNLKNKTSIIQWDCRNLKNEFVEKFDIVIFTYSLSGAPEQEFILKNSIEYCKKNGVIGILDWSTLFKGNKYFKQNKVITFMRDLKNKISSKDTGFSNHIDPWKFIFENRKNIKIIKNESLNNYDKDDYLTLILQKK